MRIGGERSLAVKMSKRFWAERARANRREERPKVSMMRFKSGNHEGETTEEVLLKHPNFAQWTIERYPESPRGQAFIRLSQEFDDKPFTEDCREECGRRPLARLHVGTVAGCISGATNVIHSPPERGKWRLFTSFTPLASCYATLIRTLTGTVL